MAIGRISGSVLKSNLTRNGTDLAFETNLLYLDVTNSRVGIGTSEPSTPLHVNGTITASGLTGLSSIGITNTSVGDSLLITTTENSSTAGPVITLKRNSASPADADYLGQIKFKGENDNDQEIVYGKITGKIQDASDGTEDGIIEFANKKAGGNVITARLRSDSLQLLNGTNLSVAGTLTASSLSYPSADGNNGQVLTTDGSGTLSFADSTGGGGGTNTAVEEINYYSLDTTSAVVDQFDLTEYRGAIYDVSIEDIGNSFTGHLKVSIIHDDSTPYISVYDVNEDSTRIVDFTAAISGNNLQLSAATNSSSNVTLRMQRTALGDHHESVANTNTKIIKTTTPITSSATELDYFTKTDIQSAKYIILTKDSTQGDYSIQEMSLVHNGTNVFMNTYGTVSSRTTSPITFTSSITGSTCTLFGATTMGTTATAILYRIDLGSKTKIGTFDNVTYKKIKDVDSAVATIDDFDVYKNVSAKYFVSISNSDETQYQNAEITLNVNSAKNNATMSQTSVSTGTYDLANFTADVSGGKARLRMAGSPANNVVYVARMSVAKELSYYQDTGTGLAKFTYDTQLDDGLQLKFGTGGDGHIKHTGSNLQMIETTGNINIRTYANDSDVTLSSDDGSGGLTDYLKADGSTGELKLYHYGTEKFKTISTGVQIDKNVDIIQGNSHSLQAKDSTGAYVAKNYLLWGTTTNAVETEIFVGGVTNSRIAVGANTTINYSVQVVARRTDATGESAAWELKAVGDSFSGTVADVGNVYEVVVARDDTNWQVDARADDTNNAIGIFVTGAAGKTIRWVAEIETSEINIV
jgi:hypothetical protein